MKLSELYKHKAAYDEIMAVLAKHVEYSQKYKYQTKERRVKALEEELAKLKGGAK